MLIKKKKIFFWTNKISIKNKNSGFFFLLNMKRARDEQETKQEKESKACNMAVIGSRTFADFPFLTTSLDTVNKEYPFTCIVSGGAIGADQLGEKYARQHSIPTLIFKPDWKKHGKSAGFIRNHDILEHSDVVVAFWDGISKGTSHSISEAKKLKKPLFVFYYLRVNFSCEKFNV